MKIETKFDIGAEVFTIINGKIAKRIVHSIALFIHSKEDKEPSYTLKDPAEPANAYVSSVSGIKEGLLFGSKKDLLASLES